MNVKRTPLTTTNTISKLATLKFAIYNDGNADFPMMKVILSRKGFDSRYGGYASPILQDDRMISLPIPEENTEVCYSDLKWNGRESYFELMKSVKPKIKSDDEWQTLTEGTACHLDPDISMDIIEREHSWKGLFGQTGIAQSHLSNKEKKVVEAGDIFLFFGWFKHTREKNGKLTFDNKKGDKHVIFGYLQIDDIINVVSTTNIPGWMKYHPHCKPYYQNDKLNTLYVARKRLSWNSNISGFGTFNYDKSLLLTKEGKSRSKWELPEFFKGVSISYHNESSWINDYFQSAKRGQEFVISDENGAAIEWAKELIEKNVRITD